jgi:hypothetical protein
MMSTESELEWFAAHPGDAATISRAMTNMADGIRPGVVA